MTDEGDQLPGKKGISITPPAWNKLKTLIAEIDDAIKEGLDEWNNDEFTKALFKKVLLTKL